jgi:signal transduction histidine kinase
MTSVREQLGQSRRAQVFVYSVAGALPIGIAALTVLLAAPGFVFEHLIVLLIVGVAVITGRRPAAMAAVSGAFGDNLLLREPLGRPAITGARDVVDLGLFLVVAIVVGWLVDSLHVARVRAVEAAERERRAREERDRIVATVTHDLATPLDIIQVATRFARAQRSSFDADTMTRMRRIETAVMRATSLLRSLADNLSIERGALHVELLPLDFQAVVEPIARMFDGASTRHPIALTMEPAPLVIRGDAERLARLVENLIANAIKYSPDGGPVEVSVEREGGSAVLRVRDYGIGIPADAGERLFEIGYRNEQAATIAPGLGLGLHIAAEIVRRHGGRIAASTAQGGGTMFTVRLPLAPQPQMHRDDHMATDAMKTSVHAVH